MLEGNINEGAFCTYKFKSQRSWLTIVLSLYIAFVFIQSLFYKFADAPETQYIFATLDAWAAGFAVPGLFVPGGIFSAKVIGTFELISSSLLLAALATRLVMLRVAGCLVAIAIISGAIFFHLFTPLGIVVQDDGGLLFGMACGVWLASATMLLRDRDYIFKAIGLKKA